MCVKIQIFRHHARSKESNLQDDGTLTLGDSNVLLGLSLPGWNAHLISGAWLGYNFLLASLTNLFHVSHIPSCQRNGM